MGDWRATKNKLNSLVRCDDLYVLGEPKCDRSVDRRSDFGGVELEYTARSDIDLV